MVILMQRQQSKARGGYNIKLSSANRGLELCRVYEEEVTCSFNALTYIG